MKKAFLLATGLFCIVLLAFANGAQESKKTVNLVVQVAGYTPDAPQAVGPKLVAAKAIAEEYQKTHPGVTIEFYPATNDPQEWTTALKTGLVGGVAPDITWVQITEFWTDINKGWFLPLDEYLNKPNPYAKGNKKWIDLFTSDLSMRYRAPDDKLYTISIDLVDTGIFYNKKIFAELGLKVPTTWAEYIGVLKKIKDSGKYIPMAYHSALLCDWTDCVIRETLQKDLMEQINLNKDNRVSLDEFCKAYKQGLYKSSDASMQETFRIIKDWSQYWQDGWATAKAADMTRLFATSQAATMWDASWTMRQMKYDPAISFEWGIFPLPPITKESSPIAKGYTIPSVGGIGEQLAITNTAINGGKVDVAVDFLMYWTAPENAAKLLNERMVYLPSIIGIPSAPEMEPFKAALENWKNYWWDGRLGSEVYGKMTDDIWVPFLLGKTNVKEATERREALLAKTVDEVIKKQGWNF